MKRRAAAYNYPFEAWAANEYPKQDRATVIDAVSALANCTDNVSRQLLSSSIIDVFDKNDEVEFAELLNDWARSNEEYRKQSSRPNQSSEPEASSLEDTQSSDNESQQTLKDRISRSDESNDTESNSDSVGHNLNSLSLSNSESNTESGEHTQ